LIHVRGLEVALGSDDILTTDDSGGIIGGLAHFPEGAIFR
jgi:hypothetical protein